MAKERKSNSSGGAGQRSESKGARGAESRGKQGAEPRATRGAETLRDSPFGAWRREELPGGSYLVAGLPELARATGADLPRLPYSLRVLLENALRHCGQGVVEEADVLALLRWESGAAGGRELAFFPARVLLQDLTGVPCVVDLAALRSAMVRLGGDPTLIDPSVPVDLVVDHSLQVDFAGTSDACARNMELEMQRNAERYALLRWAQREFGRLRIVPPGAGICHQVNLEFLAEVVRTGGAAGPGGQPAPQRRGRGRAAWAHPDTVIGTDSHTTMINGLGVLGWGVGGIEAEAVMLGQPYFMLVPQVVGVRLTGRLSPAATATDLVLTITELLRKVGVVGRFVEFFGPGVNGLTLADRATVANMAPEYGATCGFFAVDQETIRYLRETGRPTELCARVEAYCRRQALWREPGTPDPEYSRVVELDLAEVQPALAGPRRPQERVLLGDLRRGFRAALPSLAQGRSEPRAVEVDLGGEAQVLRDGAVAIASITSCTNTSNPALMLAAGLVARNALTLGLRPKPHVRTSLIPGSRAVTGYLEAAGLRQPLEALGFAVAGYGCATCIGNSGPLPEILTRAVEQEGLVLTAVLSGNRNFEARIHPSVRANYLASPPLVVAFALAGTVDIDLEREPLGTGASGSPVYLRDLWPDGEELAALVSQALSPELFRREYEAALAGSEAWRMLPVPEGALFRWDETSTYVKEPPFLSAPRLASISPSDLAGARILAVLGDSVTTDHISPAGAIPVDSPAGRYLLEQGVAPADFNTYGARRGNHEVLVRGTFANVRLRNLLAGGREGGWTVHQPSGETVPIYEAARRYQEEGVPLVVFAGREYGTGSSRDWAAKGPALLGVRVIIAESFERIHRSNLVGMGILPLELETGVTVAGLELEGSELVDTAGIGPDLAPGGVVQVTIRRPRGKTTRLACQARLDSRVDVDNYLSGGILPRVLRLLLAAQP